MRIKYADLELRWMSFQVFKSPKLETRITSSLGYYHPQSGNWVHLGDGPAVILDEQATIAATMMPLPEQLDTLGKVIEGSSYMALSGAYVKNVSLRFLDSLGQAIDRISGVAHLDVPGRQRISITLPGVFRTVIAARATITVQAEGYQTVTRTVSILDDMTIDITLEGLE